MAEDRRQWIVLLGKERCGTLAAKDLVDWAVGALSEGMDTPAIRQLAGMDLEGPRLTAAAMPQFRRALQELGIPVPAPDAAAREYVRVLVEDIVEGRVTPQPQVERIHKEIVTPLDHPKDLMVWCYLSSGLRPQELSTDPDRMVHFEEVHGAALDGAIRDVARWYLHQSRSA